MAGWPEVNPTTSAIPDAAGSTFVQNIPRPYGLTPVGFMLSLFCSGTDFQKGFGAWGPVAGGSVIASAALDPAQRHSHVLNIRGESFHLREKRQAGLSPCNSTATRRRKWPPTTTQTDRIAEQPQRT